MEMGEFSHPVIRWSMYDSRPMRELAEKLEEDGREDPTVEEFDRAYDSQVMRLETDAPPGIHDFVIEGERFHGVVVRDDGTLDPALTAHAVHIAQTARHQRANYPYIFLEKVQWDPENRRFEVGLGS